MTVPESADIVRTMPSISSAISQRRRRLSELEAERERILKEIDTLINAAALLGEAIDTVTPPMDRTEDVVRRGGKPPGAISGRWKAVLGDLLPAGTSHTIEDILAAAQIRDPSTESSAVKERVRKFLEFGHLQRSEDNRYTVSPEAIARFKLGAADASASQENETEETAQEDNSEIGGLGDTM